MLNKLNTFRTLLFCLIGFFLVSCKSYYATLNIETPIPSTQELPASIQSITLMNRSITNQYQDYENDSLQKYFYRNGYQLSKDVLDSSVSDTIIMALAKLLFESGRYDVVVPVERYIKRDLPYQLLPDTLPTWQIKQICEAYNTDALMVLERFSTRVMADFSRERTIASNYYYASLDIKYNAYFRVYRPGKDKLVKEIELTDTIYRENADYTQVQLFSRIPSIKQALINSAIKIALDTDNKISPTWVSEKRGYFLFDLKNDPGRQLINRNKTQEAKAFWMKMAQSPKKKIKARAEYNLAVASELEGNIDQAIEWGVKSFYTYYQHQTEVYLKKLQAIKKNKQPK